MLRCVREYVSTQDGTTPPVVFVVGTAGAGKSSLVTAFQRWARFLEVDVLAMNLDPGAERVHYDPEFDVRDLVSLSDVMDEYDLGPNGAQILAADLVAAQAEDVFEEIEGISGDILIIDTPGQVELFAFREASNHLVQVLGRGMACLVTLRSDAFPDSKWIRISDASLIYCAFQTWFANSEFPIKI